VGTSMGVAHSNLRPATGGCLAGTRTLYLLITRLRFKVTEKAPRRNRALSPLMIRCVLVLTNGFTNRQRLPFGSLVRNMPTSVCKSAAVTDSICDRGGVGRVPEASGSAKCLARLDGEEAASRK
jgi:hypothetical protein